MAGLDLGPAEGRNRSASPVAAMNTHPSDLLSTTLGSFSEEGLEAQPIPGLLAYGQVVQHDLLDGDEVVILAVKPSMWYLVLVSARWLIGAAAVILLAPWLVGVYTAVTQTGLTQAALVVTSLRLVLALLQWSSRLYVLTNRRVMCYRGITQVTLLEAPLVQIRNTYVNDRRLERWCNVGSIGFSLKGSKRVDMWWEQVSAPEEIHDRIRRAIEKALDSHTPY